ncbi:NupC/NupG family nucleoside CNT transporter [Schleiferia thermophila]|jgi:CNT family concentrative nucleoside transporter|uniref:CNT family concentrative nucleoside transporter n=1 Tax=Schleiferia thermophila TaxID=884107 RepID=A0A369A3K2_9FLAO|nr:nucleoside transporter C-terminal domain-containing protein [Schleiferia thermophila]KFD38754.1 NupC family nucleoside transporter [Schleiferia thermophila str. Yellowstone]RCX02034.1 CNT family concentrative nucleoside transporter [Schleiferia thermophila]
MNTKTRLLLTVILFFLLHFAYCFAQSAEVQLDSLDGHTEGLLINMSENIPAERPVVSENNNLSSAIRTFNTGSFSLQSLLRGILGLTVLLIIGALISKDRKQINWWLIGKGLAIQILIAISVLKLVWVQNVVNFISQKFVLLLSFTQNGARFLFGSIIENTESFGFIFAFQVLPTVIFFSALTSLLFYYGILQKVVYAFAWFMKYTLRLSGAESLSAAGNIFLGQTESPLLVKPYLSKMTRSELLCVMTGGMATIAGGVLAAYIGFLGGNDPEMQVFFAKHLITASVMAAPGAIVASKLLLPETEKFSEEMHIEQNKIGSNALEAIANGTTDGLKLAVNVAAMLLVFISLIALMNYILMNAVGELAGINEAIKTLTKGQYQGLSLQFILGYILAPLTWLMGVNGTDIVLVGQLLGEKSILNEFVAYVSMSQIIQSGGFVDPKSIIIATYILCGFANFASIGIQIGGIGSLAPNRKSDLSRLGIYALIGGNMASMFTAIIVGVLI